MSTIQIQEHGFGACNMRFDECEGAGSPLSGPLVWFGKYSQGHEDSNCNCFSFSGEQAMLSDVDDVN